MSKNEEFIKEYLLSKDWYDGVLEIITEERFNKLTKNIKPSQVYYSSFLGNYDVDNMLHPLQKIYEIEYYMSSYPNGSMNFGYQMVFKYKKVFYEFQSYGGN